MVDYPSPYRLLEEARKTWDYFVSDEVVYEGKFIDRQRSRVVSWVDDYLSNDVWFEGCTTINDGAISRAVGFIVENCRRKTGVVPVQSNPSLGKSRRNNTVFVGIREKLQILEQVEFRPIRSIVWLKGFDFAQGIRERELKGLPLVNSSHELTRIITQRKGDPTLLPVIELDSHSTDMQHGKFPSNVVQRVPQIGNDIANNETPSVFDGHIDTNLYEFHIPLRVGLLSNGVLWMELPQDTPFESVDVYIRPLNLQPGAIKWVHGSDYTPKRACPNRDYC